MNRPDPYDEGWSLNIFEGWSWNPLNWWRAAIDRVTNAQVVAKVESLEKELHNLRQANDNMKVSRDIARAERDSHKQFINIMVEDLKQIKTIVDETQVL